MTENNQPDGKPHPSPAAASEAGAVDQREVDTVPLSDALPSWKPITPVRPGSVVDHFRVLRTLGHGSMGEVFLAQDTELGRMVALKVLQPRSIGSQEAMDRFVQEARTTARFNHPHIVTIFAVGEYQGSPYVALEYLEGGDLRQRLLAEQPGIKEAIRIGMEIADALREAHRHQILHRDLKPENVMLPRDGRLRVVDLGLAKLIASDRRPEQDDTSRALDTDQEISSSEIQTHSDVIHGTPAYMAPEQWENHRITPAADIWALGMILHEMLGGQRPYAGLSKLTLWEEIVDPEPVPELKPPAGAPPELVELVMQCLSKDRGQRPSAEEVYEQLHDLLYEGRRPPQLGVNPYRGLLPFAERHAPQFFGRNAEIDAFLERLREQPVLPVIGPSGAGKSSFVQAGVIPRLREQGDWAVLSMRPGRRPFQTLASRLTRGETVFHGSRTSSFGSTESSFGSDEPNVSFLDESDLCNQLLLSPSLLSLVLRLRAEDEGNRLLLFVDQAEELFTLVEDEQERQKFVTALCSAADDPHGPARVVFTLRDDFLIQMAESEVARDVLGQITVLRSPDAAQLRRIVVRPLEEAGYRFADATLPDEMVRAVHGEPASLPLLQFTCSKLWEYRDETERLIPRAAYDALGGVEGALAGHADGILESLTRPQLSVARSILLRLITPQRTRKTVTRTQLLEGLGENASTVLDRLVQQRIVLVRKSRQQRGVAQIELVHESLIRNWQQLQRWIAESREELAFLAEVGQAADLWRNRGSRAEELWEGDALHDAIRWSERLAVVPSAIQHFLDEGLAKEHRVKQRRRRRTAGAFTLLTLVAIVLAILSVEALRQRGEAVARGELAQQRRADALLEAARASLERQDLLDARIQLRSALEIKDSPLGRAVWWEISYNPLRWRREVPGGGIGDLAFSPDGTTLAACGTSACLFDLATGEKEIVRGGAGYTHSTQFFPGSQHVFFDHQIWDRQSQKLRTLPPHGQGWQNTRMSPDGRFLATMGNDRDVRLLDAESGQQVAVMNNARSRWFCADGETLAVLFRDDTVRTYAVGTWTELVTVNAGADRLTGLSRVSCLADGSPVAFSTRHRQAWRWNVAADRREPLAEETASIKYLLVAPTGRRLASILDDGFVRVDELDGRDVRLGRGDQGHPRDLCFSGDGERLAVLDRDGTAQVWDIASGGDLGTFPAVGFAALGPGGRWLATESETGVISLWDLEIPRRVPQETGHRELVVGLDISPDGQLLASGSHDGTIRIWDTGTGAQQHVLRGHTDDVYCTNFHPHLDLLASGGWDGTIRLWDPTTGEARGVIEVPEANDIFDLDFSPDGEILASTGRDGNVRLWRMPEGEPAEVLRASETPTTGVRFDPTGRWLATSLRDGSVTVWDRRMKGPPRVLKGHEQWVWFLDFSPDGSKLASCGIDGTIRLWDLPSGSGRTLATLPGRVYSVAFDPRGNRLAATCSDGNAYLIDLHGGPREILRGHQGEVNRIHFSADGSFLATSSDDKTVRVWDATTGKPHWRASALLGSPPELCTPAGWSGFEEPVVSTVAAGSPPAWRRSVRERGLVTSAAPNQPLLCVGTTGEAIELWDRDQDRRLWSRSIDGIEQVLALDDCCLSLSHDGILRHHDLDGDSQQLQAGCTAMGAASTGLLSASGHQIHHHEVPGTPPATTRAVAEVTALTQVDDWIAVGYREGDLDLLSVRGDETPPHLRIEKPPYSPVTRLIPGPSGLIVAGYGDGTVGIWSLEDGQSLHRTHLHGPIRHLLIDGQTLYIASELGDRMTIDLTVFFEERCDLLREVWDQSPVTWQHGVPILTPPPADHPCAAGQ